MGKLMQIIRKFIVDMLSNRCPHCNGRAYYYDDKIEGPYWLKIYKCRVCEKEFL